jgi:hypothetical protein
MAAWRAKATPPEHPQPNGIGKRNHPSDHGAANLNSG